MRQIRGVESNKLQPIIRYHQDKDFRVPRPDPNSSNGMGLEMLDYGRIMRGKGREQKPLELEEDDEDEEEEEEDSQHK